MNYHQVERKHNFFAITLCFFFHLSFRTWVLDHRIMTKSRQYFDIKALEYTPAAIYWKRFRDDIFILGHMVLVNLIYFLIT